jgi:cytochrome P450
MPAKSVLYDPLDPATAADPYPVYARLRDEAPACHVEADDVWAVSRYEDVTAVLRDPATFSSAAMRDFMTGGAARRHRARNPWADQASVLFGDSRVVLAVDPPDHTVLRRLLSRSFTPRAIEARRAMVERICDRLVDDLLTAAGDVPVDFVPSVSWPLPVLVIAEMLGVPPEHLEDFKRWSDEIVDLVSGVGESVMYPTALAELVVYMGQLLAERRARPPGDDLVGLLLQSEGGGGDTLTPIEIASFCMLLLVAGNETTTSLLGNALAALLANPDQFERLRAEPDLVRSCLEESLRYDSPFQGLYRTTTRPASVAGVDLPDGAVLLVLFASANRDERHFPEPDRFDVARNPVDHVGFGAGIHLCLGAPLARLEAEVVLRALLQRTERIESAGDVVRMPSHILRSVTSLPIRVVPR